MQNKSNSHNQIPTLLERSDLDKSQLSTDSKESPAIQKQKGVKQRFRQKAVGVNVANTCMENGTADSEGGSRFYSRKSRYSAKSDKNEQLEPLMPTSVKSHNGTIKSQLFNIRWLIARGFELLMAGIKVIIGYCLKHPIHGCFIAVLSFLLFALIDTGSEVYTQLNHKLIPEQTLNEIFKASRFTRSFDSENASKDKSQEFFMVGGPTWVQREGVRVTLLHARNAGLSIEHQAVLLTIVEIESGFNPVARAPTSSACGLFQFIHSTGQRYQLNKQNCMDPMLNAKAGVDHYLDNFNRRVKSKIQTLSGTEKIFKLFELSYYLHHDGPKSSNPSTKLKATILGGTPFLLRVYEILKAEQAAQEVKPNFFDLFSKNLESMFSTLLTKLQNAGHFIKTVFS